MLNTPINKYIPIWYYLSHNITQSDRSSHCHHHCAPAAAVSTSAWPEEILTNQVSVFRSCDHYWPIRGQYSGHVTNIDQAGVSIYLLNLPGHLDIVPGPWLSPRHLSCLPEGYIQSGIVMGSVKISCIMVSSEIPIPAYNDMCDMWWPLHCYLGAVSTLTPDTEAESEERREGPVAPITLLLQCLDVRRQTLSWLFIMSVIVSHEEK